MTLVDRYAVPSSGDAMIGFPTAFPESIEPNQGASGRDEGGFCRSAWVQK
jgi:hypothetical protein